MTHRTILWTAAALLGIAVTAAVAWAASQLAGQRIGLAAAPLSVQRGLAPASRAVLAPVPRRHHQHPRPQGPRPASTHGPAVVHTVQQPSTVTTTAPAPPAVVTVTTSPPPATAPSQIHTQSTTGANPSSSATGGGHDDSGGGSSNGGGSSGSGSSGPDD